MTASSDAAHAAADGLDKVLAVGEDDVGVVVHRSSDQMPATGFRSGAKVGSWTMASQLCSATYCRNRLQR